MYSGRDLHTPQKSCLGKLSLKNHIFIVFLLKNREYISYDKHTPQTNFMFFFPPKENVFIQNATCTLPRGRPKPGQQVRATSGTDPEFANTAVTICKLVFTKGVRYPSFFWSKKYIQLPYMERHSKCWSYQN